MKHGIFSSEYVESREPAKVAQKVVAIITKLENQNASSEEWEIAKDKVEKLLQNAILKHSSKRSPDTQNFYEKEYQKYFKKNS